MAAKKSAGLLLYRRRNDAVEVFLVHPGGPFWQKKDLHAWSIPKGEIDEDEDPRQAARREFGEEVGTCPDGELIPLTPIKQSGGKIIHVWALEADYDPDTIKSNSFSLEWPPHSGKWQSFPEVDRAAWFAIDDAESKIHKGQVGFLTQLRKLIAG